jgi:hypothetical protein
MKRELRLVVPYIRHHGSDDFPLHTPSPLTMGKIRDKK